MKRKINTRFKEENNGKKILKLNKVVEIDIKIIRRSWREFELFWLVISFGLFIKKAFNWQKCMQ